ncbi:adenosylmethionine--8-amino-7-oxononanoate transaminase [Stieleria sp. TO1_6]|uniref:adenosylmethionine--8-amino-7-oxononanoate transaminase n=1 Tax=Stieleria tagensis TaxID=2956795 RepID=UPI00209AF358|nr:adenosylmethionine--8-amino-7-oxononanoate transaminase [Stieleria tagensis]MCO8121550.1 adenosylmethionine--8-amino-7-oxononanoate transaminase [Stieleria tagensis]
MTTFTPRTAGTADANTHVDASQPKPAWQQSGERHIWMPYCQMKTAPQPIAVQRTEGVYLHLANGRRLIDGLASWWSACHGYNHPHLVAAMQRQVATMSHVMFGGVQHRPALALAERLAALLPGDLNRVFFADSGSVAVEVAMKMAIQFHRNHGQPNRTRFVSFANAYHGDTTGAMSLCDPQRSMHAEFDGALLQQIHTELPRDADAVDRFDQLLQENGDRLAGVFVEPLVQGAGGMRFHDASVLRSIARCCRRHGVLLIADELATGFGRTGSMFAIEQADVVPDIICLGKALTAGMIGLAATVATDHVFDAFWSDRASDALMHGPTFMANPLACAAAGASLDLFESEPRLDQVASIESDLVSLLAPCRELPGVVDVRVKGAIGVVQVGQLDHVDRLRSALIDQGVWIRPFGDCIYTTPPLVVSPTELRQIGRAMVSVTEQWSTWPR